MMCALMRASLKSVKGEVEAEAADAAGTHGRPYLCTFGQGARCARALFDENENS